MDGLRRAHAFLDVAVYLPDPAHGVLLLIARDAVLTVPEPPVDDGATLPIDSSVSGWVTRSAAAALVADTAAAPSRSGRDGGFIRSELAVPILASGGVVAVISVRSPRVAAFDITDLERVQVIAREAGEALPGSLDPSRSEA